MPAHPSTLPLDPLPAQADPVVAAAYASCRSALGRLSKKDFANRCAIIRRATAELGEHSSRVKDQQNDGARYRLDPLPLILGGEEWEFLRRAVLQRAHAFAAFIKDIHSEQRILHSGVVPAEVVLEDPAWFPELHGLVTPREEPLQVGAVDLTQTADGRWIVLENRFSTPTGVAYLIQIRRIMAEALPEMFTNLPVHAVAPFAARLAETMASASADGNAGNASVMLSAGDTGRHFIEEAFLARQMGIPLVRCADLLVRDNKLHLKTVTGLLPVKVIYRRMENPLLDPIGFSAEQAAGIPGLVHAVRHDTVRVVNGLGCGIADNRALLPYSNAIIRFYLGESALLPSATTYHGFDPDHMDFRSEHADQLLWKPVAHPENLAAANAVAAKLCSTGRLAELARIDPRLCIAQQLPALREHPFRQHTTWTRQPVVLRLFFTMGRQPMVLPGGLARAFSATGHDSATPDLSALKDAWVVDPRTAISGRPRRHRLEAELTPAEPALTSRAAEAWYWMGRQLERARSTARKRRVLESLTFDELSPHERNLQLPLLKAIARQSDIPLPKQSTSDTTAFYDSLLFSGQHPGSVRSCIQAFVTNASSIRDLLTPELMRVAHETAQILTDPPKEPLARRELLSAIVRQTDLLHAVGERTLLHDSGWQLFLAGLYMERAEGNAELIQTMLPHLVTRQYEHLRDDSDLTALLRILGALDAYHRKFRSRAYLDRCAHLFWKEPQCTASMRFCLRSATDALTAAFAGMHNQHAEHLLQSCRTSLASLDALDIGAIFPARVLELDHGLRRANLHPADSLQLAKDVCSELIATLASLHRQLQDNFFTHHPESRRLA